MTDYRFVQVDAFAEQAFAGNPAAVMPLDAWLPDATLQAIAEENNLAETAFIIPTDGDADYELRWFTPAVEVRMCGHATLASGHVLLGDDPTRDHVRFRTRQAGVLEVRRAGAGYELDLPAWAPSGCEAFAFCDQVGAGSIDWASRDGGYAILVYASEKEVRALDPDFRTLGKSGNVLIIATAPGEDHDIVSRVFAPGAGIDEDPVTGSAHALLVPYWAAKLGRTAFTAFQASPRGGRLDCRLEGDRVVLGGRCTTVIEGVFRI